MSEYKLNLEALTEIANTMRQVWVEQAAVADNTAVVEALTDISGKLDTTNALLTEIRDAQAETVAESNGRKGIRTTDLIGSLI